MTKIKVSLKTLKVNEPMMLFWSLIPLIVLIIATNYLFNSNQEVLGTNTESEEVLVSKEDINKKIVERNNNFKLNRTGVVTVLFAGATKNQFEVGYPILESKNIKGAVSAPTSEIGEIESKMTWLNLRLLQHQGWEIVSQSRDQICETEKLNDQSVLDSEIVGSKKDLEEYGLYVNAYLAPCGINTTQILNTVKGSYRSFIGFGVLSNSVNSSNKYNLVARNINNEIDINDIKKWIRDTSLNNQWLIIVVPDINDTNDKYSITKELFELVVNEISTSKNQTATFGQVIKY
jgi:hypothetical protein